MTFFAHTLLEVKMGVHEFLFASLSVSPSVSQSVRKSIKLCLHDLLMWIKASGWLLTPTSIKDLFFYAIGIPVGPKTEMFLDYTLKLESHK